MSTRLIVLPSGTMKDSFNAVATPTLVNGTAQSVTVTVSTVIFIGGIFYWVQDYQATIPAGQSISPSFNVPVPSTTGLPLTGPVTLSLTVQTPTGALPVHVSPILAEIKDVIINTLSASAGLHGAGSMIPRTSFAYGASIILSGSATNTGTAGSQIYVRLTIDDPYLGRYVFLQGSAGYVVPGGTGSFDIDLTANGAWLAVGTYTLYWEIGSDLQALTQKGSATFTVS